MEHKVLKVLYRGKLPIGGVELDCYVLDDDDKNPTRIISGRAIQRAFDITPRGMNLERKERVEKAIRERFPEFDARTPVFLDSTGIIPYFSPNLINMARTIVFKDNGAEIEGYNANILPELCSAYLRADIDDVLLKHQKNRVRQASILLEAFAKVGITALIDEATGYQSNRKSDALRLLLDTYLADGIKKWIKEFPDDFFYELDRLYGNEKLKSNQRPSYYGSFINKYVYEPIENGKVNPELQKRYIADGKHNRKHQHFTDFGTGQLRIQIGKILGLMQVAPNLKWFKQKQERLGQLSLFPDME